MTLGECLAEGRRYRGLTQPALAELLGIPYRNRSIVGGYENDKRHMQITKLAPYAQALNITLTLRDGEWSWRPIG
jgi:transcriptional regulator with XRE-family HTH domain